MTWRSLHVPVLLALKFLKTALPSRSLRGLHDRGEIWHDLACLESRCLRCHPGFICSDVYCWGAGTLIGCLPNNFLAVHAGSKLGELSSFRELYSPVRSLGSPDSAW